MKLFRNFLSLAVAEVISKLVTFAAFAYLARKLGPSTFGSIEFAAAVLMCASLLVDQGFNAFGAREIAKTPHRTGRLTAEIVTARMGLAIGSYLTVVLFAVLVNRGPVVLRLLLIYGLSLLLLPFLLQWVFQGHDRMKLVAVAQVIRQTVFAVVVFAFVRSADQVVMVAWAEVAAVASAAAFCLFTYRRYFRDETRMRPTVSRQLFREGVPIGLSQMFWVVKMFGGTLILGIIASTQTVAYYAGAQRILVALHAFVWLYYFNLLPSMSRAWQRSQSDFNAMIQSSMQVAVWVALAGGLIWAAVSSFVIQTVYGPQFAAGGTVLGIFGAVWAMALISGHYRFGLIAAGYSGIEMMTSMLGAAFALLLIPIGYFKGGVNGAAMGLVAAEAGVWLSSWWCARTFLRLKSNAEALRVTRVTEDAS